MSTPSVRLSLEQLQTIERAAEAAYPEEACGLLIGRSAPGGAWRVSAVEASANVAEPPRTRRFEVDPKLRLRLERELRESPDSILGVYHSHPNGRAEPSETDISMIFEPHMIWLITAVADGRAGATMAYKPTEDGSAFRPLGLDLGGKETERVGGTDRMDFRSDNVASAAPEIVDAVVEASRSSAAPYGGDPWTLGLEPAFSELFETPVKVFPVVTGTAANSVAVATLTPPWGVIYAGRAAHVENDECGAPEFMTGGAKVTGIDERFGKIVPEALEAALAAAGTGEVHWSQPACLSLTQSTEMGQIYTPDELAVLTGIARRHALAVHMDGARFANAVAGSGKSPADLTWRAGVDALSFGATKNGALAAEAIVLFDDARAGELAFRHKRAGQLLSKMRFVSAQLAAYIADGLWLRLAEQANRQAQRLAHGLEGVPGASLAVPAEANELFVTLPRAVIDGLAEAGVLFYSWPETDPATTTIRLVTRHDTDPGEVDRLVETAHRLAAAAA